MITEAIILAGGFGTRLGSLTADTPKPMLPVANRPFIFYLFDYLLQNGIKTAILATGYLAEKFEHHIGTNYRELKLQYSPEENPLGTGGAIAKALTLCRSKTLLALNGDTYFPVSLSEMEDIHKKYLSSATLALRKVPNAGRYGSIITKGSLIASMEEKGCEQESLVNGGVYLLDKQKFSAESPAEVFSFEKDLLPAWIAKQQIACLTSSAYFIDIGIPTDYQRAQNELRF